MHAHKRSIPLADPFSFPSAAALPTGEADFLPELHRARLTAQMTHRFREEMSVKTASTADARKKRQK